MSGGGARHNILELDVLSCIVKICKGVTYDVRIINYKHMK